MNDISKKVFWMILGFLILARISTVVLLMNDIPHTGVQMNGWWFYHGGDEQTYFNLAKPLSQLSVEKSVVTLGFPLFLAPIIYLTKAVQVADILKPVFFIQAFVLFSLSIVLVILISRKIFKNRIVSLLCASAFTFYPYIFYLLFHKAGPYYPALGLTSGQMSFQYLNWLQVTSDPLSAFLVYLCFFLFLTEFYKDNARYSMLVLLGIVAGFAGLVRISNVLIVGIFVLAWLLKRKIKEALLIGGFSFFIILPQLIYNYIFFDFPLRFGYEVYWGRSIDSVFSLIRWTYLFNKASSYIPGFLFLFLGGLFLFGLGIKYLWNRNRIIALSIVLWFLSYTLLYGSFMEGGLQPRFFIPMIPSFIILTAACFLQIIQWSKNKFLTNKA